MMRESEEDLQTAACEERMRSQARKRGRGGELRSSQVIEHEWDREGEAQLSTGEQLSPQDLAEGLFQMRQIKGMLSTSVRAW
jgi:hypothetical protein